MLSTLASYFRLLLGHLQIFAHFQKSVIEHGVHFDRRKYLSVYGALDRYCLFQYRATQRRGDAHLPPRTYPLTISKATPFFQVATVCYLLHLLRGLALVFLPVCTDTRPKRIAIGVQLWSTESFTYLETTFLFWSLIQNGFLNFTLTSSLLDYKWLSVYVMSDERDDYLHPSTFGLSPAQYRVFHLFRSFCQAGYYAIMLTLPLLAPVAYFLLFQREGLWQTNLLSSAFWLIFHSFYAFYSCLIMYNHLLVFLVVAKYLQLKHQSMASLLEGVLLARQSRPHRKGSRFQAREAMCVKFLAHVTRYVYLNEERTDTNRFWSSALTFTFFNYCSLIAYILYIIFFSKVYLFIKLLYCLVIYFHLLIFSAIIHLCGSSARRHGRLVATLSARVPMMNLGASVRPRFCQMLKAQSLLFSFKSTRAGFSLLNGYIISYDTFRVISVNIAIYFMLAFHI